MRIGANTNESRSDNTSGRPLRFNGLTGLQYTHDLLTRQPADIGGDSYHQIQSCSGHLPSPDRLQMSGSDTSQAALGTRAYEMDQHGARWIKLSSNVRGGPSPSSRHFPMTFSLPSLLAGSEYVYLFSQFGTNFRNGGGSEERVAVIPELSVAWLLALGLLVVVLRRAPLRSGSNCLWRMRSEALAGAAAWGEIDRRAVMAPTIRLSGGPRGNEARPGRSIDAAQPL